MTNYRKMLDEVRRIGMDYKWAKMFVKKLKDVMPKYYLYIENDGRYTYLMDCPNDIKKDEQFIDHLLEREGVLALKPNSGTSGGLPWMKICID